MHGSFSIPSVVILYCAHLCMKCSLGISDFLEEISSFSHFLPQTVQQKWVYLTAAKIEIQSLELWQAMCKERRSLLKRIKGSWQGYSKQSIQGRN